MGLDSAYGIGSLKQGVCTSSTRPASPFEGQQIYETDTDKVLVWNGTAWYANWNLPWGLVARSTLGTSVSTSTTRADVGISVTFTAVANRYYKYTYFAYAADATAASTLNVFVTDAANTVKYVANIYVINTKYNLVNVVYTTTEAAGSTTRKIRAEMSNNAGSIFADPSIALMQLLVEDIGPV